MGDTQTEGILRLYIDLKVSVSEMRDWDADRISAFFQGAALMQNAITDRMPVTHEFCCIHGDEGTCCEHGSHAAPIDTESALRAVGFKSHDATELTAAMAGIKE